MATAYFVDSSALVKRDIRETGTAWVRGITRRRSSTDIYIALITAELLYEESTLGTSRAMLVATVQSQGSGTSLNSNCSGIVTTLLGVS